MRTPMFSWIAPAVVLAVTLGGVAAPQAEAQFFGFSYNSPGLSVGVNQPAYYGGYYPAPVVVPRPVVVAQPVIVPARPYYGGAYGYRGGYGPPHGGYYGPPHGGYYGPRGGYGYPHRPY